jgi:hypothetical protein
MDRRLSSGQVGKALGLAAATIQAYAREGRIPFALTPGGHRRFSLEEVALALSLPRKRADDRATRLAAASAFGPSRRGAAGRQLRAVRTSAFDAAAANRAVAGGPERASAGPAVRRSAAVHLLAGAQHVHLSAAL